MPLFSLRRRHERTHSTQSTTTTTTATPTTRAARAPRRVPEAIPCPNYYDIYPEDIGPMGHVVIADGEEMDVWRLIASPISPEAALKKGGCIQYSDSSCGASPQYYEFAHAAEEAYGSAAYEKVLPGSPNTSDYVASKSFPSGKGAEELTSYGGLSDEGLTEA